MSKAKAQLNYFPSSETVEVYVPNIYPAIGGSVKLLTDTLKKCETLVTKGLAETTKVIINAGGYVTSTNPSPQVVDCDGSLKVSAHMNLVLKTPAIKDKVFAALSAHVKANGGCVV